MTKKMLDTFDQYLAGEMTPADQQEFRARLQASEELRSEFLAFKTSVEAMNELPRHLDATRLAEELRQALEADHVRQFEAYENGMLSPTEKQAFDEKLQQNQLFAYRFRTYREQHMQRASAHQPAQGRIPLLGPVFRYAIAASVALLLGLAAWYLFYARLDTASLYAKYDLRAFYPEIRYALVDEDLLHKGIIDSLDLDELKVQGLRAFAQEDWDEALALLTRYVQMAEPREEEMADEINLINLYTGRAWMEKGEIDKAIETLEKADRGVVNLATYAPLQELMRWQLALAHLKNNDPRSARRVLESLLNTPDEALKEQTLNLLNELK